MFNPKINTKILLFLLLVSWPLTAQVTMIDSLLQKVQDEAEVSTLIDLHQDLYSNYFALQNDSALTHITLAKELMEQGSSVRQKFDIFTSFAEYHLSKHRYDSCLSYTDRALVYAHKIDPERLITIYTFAGQAHNFAGSYEAALRDHLQALKLSEEHQLHTKEVNVNIDLGNVYVTMENWQMAETHYQKAALLANENGLKVQLAMAQGNLGMIYANQEKWDQAIAAMKGALPVYQDLGYDLYICQLSNNLGLLYESKGDIQNALTYYLASLNQSIAIQDLASSAIAYQNIGNAYAKIDEFAHAETYFSKGIAMSDSLGKPKLLSEGLYNMSEMYEKQNNYKKALAFRTQAIFIEDSLLNAENLRTMSELRIQYETEKKERQILELNQSNLEKALAIKHKDNQLLLLFIAIGGFGVLLAFLFILYRQKQRDKLQLATINAISVTQEAERQRIASDLHDSVGSLLSALKNRLGQNRADNKESKKEMDLLDDLSSEVRQIAHNIMPITLKKFGLPAAIKGELSNLESVHHLKTSYVDFRMDERLEQQKEILIYRIVQEVLQNTLKHAKAENIDVQLTRSDHSLNVMLEDDGVGFNPQKVPKSMGMKGIISRIKILSGTFTIDSRPGRGTLINIHIPV